MKKSCLEYREAGDALALGFRFRRDPIALIFGGVWLFVWWGAIGLPGRKIATALAKPEPVSVKAWVFLIGFGTIGLFVVWHWLGLWKGWPRWSFRRPGSPSGNAAGKRSARTFIRVKESADFVRLTKGGPNRSCSISTAGQWD